MSDMNTGGVPDYIIGHLDWPTRARFVSALIVSLVILATIGFRVLRPWDPFGAISLLLVDGEFIFLLRASAVLLAACVLATIVLGARLSQFGTFAACVGLAYPVAKRGSMDYLMVRLQAGGEFNDPNLWGFLGLEMLAWTVPLAVMVIGSAVAERWINQSNNGPPTSQPGTGRVIVRGVSAVVVTSLVAIALVVLLCRSCEKGQVLFAVAAAFFLAALFGDWATGNRRVLWQVWAVPVVGLCAYGYTWFNPTRPAGLEAILTLSPNNLSAVLPIEYLAAGTAGAIFGFWTSERIRFSGKHEDSA